MSIDDRAGGPGGRAGPATTAAAPPVEPVLHPPGRDHRGALVWRWPPGTAALSSAAVGGGRTRPGWTLAIGVDRRYGRTDLAAHVAEVADECALSGPGTGLLTAVDVAGVRRAERDGVVVHATVGLGMPTWAAQADGGWSDWAPGTINVVVQLPVGLDEGAAVNAVVTVTEAKAQALVEAGVPATGTASDAVVVTWPEGAPAEAFAGPRSRWGSRMALATRDAVAAGIGPARCQRALVLGGTRSGKSAVAETLAAEHGAPVTYVATAVVDPTDADHVARVEAHRRRRPAGWTTVELGAAAGDLPTLSDVLDGTDGVVLVDSLGTWLTAHDDLAADVAGLAAAVARRRDPTILVSEEVGLAVHPPSELGRRYVDALGTLNAEVAAAVDRVLLVVAGRVLEPTAAPVTGSGRR